MNVWLITGASRGLGRVRQQATSPDHVQDQWRALALSTTDTVRD